VSHASGSEKPSHTGCVHIDSAAHLDPAHEVQRAIGCEPPRLRGQKVRTHNARCYSRVTCLHVDQFQWCTGSTLRVGVVDCVEVAVTCVCVCVCVWGGGSITSACMSWTVGVYKQLRVRLHTKELPVQEPVIQRLKNDFMVVRPYGGEAIRW